MGLLDDVKNVVNQYASGSGSALGAAAVMVAMRKLAEHST